MPIHIKSYVLLALTLISCAAACCFAPRASFAQAADMLYVIHVNGDIFIEETGAKLKVGDRIMPDTKLTYSTEAVAAAISPTKGRQTLRFEKMEQAPDTNELWAFVKNCFFPSTVNVSSRGNPPVANLEDFFEAAPLLILGDALEIPLDPAVYPPETAEFSTRYVYRNRVIEAPLEYRDNRLIIKRSNFLTIDGKTVAPADISGKWLYYGEMSVEMDLVFPDETQLKAELAALAAAFDAQADDPNARKEIEEESVGFLQEFYGKPDEENVRTWLNTHIFNKEE